MQLAGLGLKHHRLDNECSDNFKKCIRKNNITHELVPPDCHRRNMAERIQTFKNHFVLILSGVGNRFPLGYSIGTAMEHHWCFNVYIIKTRATRVSDAVFSKHQYITSPQIMLETLVMKAAAELTGALKGMVS